MKDTIVAVGSHNLLQKYKKIYEHYQFTKRIYIIRFFYHKDIVYIYSLLIANFGTISLSFYFSMHEKKAYELRELENL